MNHETTTLKMAIETYTQAFATGTGHTARAKRCDLRHFASFVRNETLVCSITRQTIEAFRDFRLRDLREKPKTVARRLSTISTLQTFLRDEHGLHITFSNGVRKPRQAPKLPDRFSDKDVRAIENSLRSTFKYDAQVCRFRVAFYLGLAQGLRSFEIRCLTVGDVDLKHKTLTTVGKQHLVADMPLADICARVVRDYLPYRAEVLETMGIEPTDARYPLLISTKGAERGRPHTFRMNAKTLWRAFHEVGMHADVERSHPHRARHTLAMRMDEAAVSPALIKRVMRHQSYQSTLSYLIHSDDQVKQAMEAHSGHAHTGSKTSKSRTPAQRRSG